MPAKTKEHETHTHSHNPGTAEAEPVILPAEPQAAQPELTGPVVTPAAGLPGTAGGFKMMPGYPMSVGAKREGICIHYGPASYATVVTGATPSGGDVFRASECGLKYIEELTCSLSADGIYAVEYVSPVGVNLPTQVILLWTVAATGAQVTAATNLSASGVRIAARGHGG